MLCGASLLSLLGLDVSQELTTALPPRRYGPQLSSLPALLSRVNFVYAS